MVDSGFGGGGEGGDDGGAGEDVRVGEVRPGGDGEGSTGVLGLDGAWGEKKGVSWKVDTRTWSWAPWFYVESAIYYTPPRSKAERKMLTSNISELPVFKEQELLSSGDFLEALDGPLAKVVYDVGVGFEDAYRVSHFLGEAEEGRGRVDVGRYTEIRLFDGDEMEEVGSKRVGAGELCARRIWYPGCSTRHGAVRLIL